MIKEIQREKYKKIRNEIQDKQTKSQIIINKLSKSKIYKKSKVIALYSPINNEVNINDLFNIAQNDNKIISYPKITSETSMSFYQVTSLNDLKLDKEGKYKIKQPQNKNIINQDKIDLMIIPGIAFDTNKNRIGYGKGYYDKYLLNSPNIYKIGICYNEQILKESIDINNHDISMDEVITDKITIK